MTRGFLLSVVIKTLGALGLVALLIAHRQAPQWDLPVRVLAFAWFVVLGVLYIALPRGRRTRRTSSRPGRRPTDDAHGAKP